MASRDWFALGARLLGLWVLYRAITDVLYLGTSVLNIRPKSVTSEFGDAHTTQMYELWYVAGYLAFALYLLFGAEHLTRWVYAESTTEGSETSDDSE